MSYSTVLRFNRAYKYFWQSLEEFCDLPLRDRADLVYLCDQVLDEEARTPLGRRALTMALGGSTGADEVIDFCRRCPFVCVYVGPDGKEYAAVPALPLLATEKQRKTMQQSACPPPPSDYEDAAVRHARMLRRNAGDVGDNEPDVASKSTDTPAKTASRPAKTRRKSANHAEPSPGYYADGGDKHSLEASKRTDTPSHARAITRECDRAIARETQPNPTKHSSLRSEGGATSAPPPTASGAPAKAAPSPALEAREAQHAEPDPEAARRRLLAAATLESLCRRGHTYTDTERTGRCPVCDALDAAPKPPRVLPPRRLPEPPAPGSPEPTMDELIAAVERERARERGEDPRVPEAVA